MTDLLTPILFILGIAAAFLFTWTWQAQRGRRALRIRTAAVLGFAVMAIAVHYQKTHKPYIAKWLAEMCREALLISDNPRRCVEYAAIIEATQSLYSVTFDGECFHAPSKPRKPKDTVPPEEEETSDNLSGDQ